MLRRLGQPFAHPDVGIGDRDNPPDSVDIAVVRELAGPIRPAEAAQEGTDQPVALAHREDGVGGDSGFHHRRQLGLVLRRLAQKLAEGVTPIGRVEPPPEAERFGRPRLDQPLHGFGHVAAGRHSQAAVDSTDNHAGIRSKRGDDPPEKQLGDGLFGDLVLRQQGQAHQCLELGGQPALLVEAALEPLGQPGLLDGVRGFPGVVGPEDRHDAEATVQRGEL